MRPGYWFPLLVFGGLAALSLPLSVLASPRLPAGGSDWPQRSLSRATSRPRHDLWPSSRKLDDQYRRFAFFGTAIGRWLVVMQIGMICTRQRAWRTWLPAMDAWRSAFIARRGPLTEPGAGC